MRIPFLFIIPLLIFSGCTNTPVARELPPPHFTDKAPVALNVGKIVFVDEYRSAARKPNVEHLFNYTPTEVVKTWVHERIRPAGGDNILEVTIKDASVVEHKLPVTGGIKGVFVVDQAARYDGRVAVEMRIFKPGTAISETQLSAEASKSITIPENATLIQRDKIYYDMTLDMAQMLGQQIERNVQQYFTLYLR